MKALQSQKEMTGLGVRIPQLQQTEYWLHNPYSTPTTPSLRTYPFAQCVEACCFRWQGLPVTHEHHTVRDDALPHGQPDAQPNAQPDALAPGRLPLLPPWRPSWVAGRARVCAALAEEGSAFRVSRPAESFHARP